MNVTNQSTNLFKSRLGPLERDVLDTLIKEKETSAKTIYNKLKKKRKTALSSVCVMLDRLYVKGLVTRKTESCRGGFRYIYEAKNTNEAYERAIIDGTVKNLMKKFGSTAVAYFNEKFGKG